MDSLTTFLRVAKEQDYQNDEYRHSEAGPKRMNRMINLVTVFIISGILYILLGVVRPDDPIVTDVSPTTEVVTETAHTTTVEQTTHDPSVSPGLQKLLSTLNSNKSGLGDIQADTLIKDVSRSAIDFTKVILELVMKGTVFLFIFTLIPYLFKLVLRWRHYERDVVGNDFEAALLKRRILSSLNISQLLSNAYKAMSNNDGDPSRQGRIEALQTFKKMKVNINTRQSLSGFTIVKNSRISFEVPINHFAVEELEKLMKNVSDVATQRTNAKSKFGALEISEDRSTWSISSQTPVKDKYYFEDPNANKDYEEYESSFGVDNFVDNTQKIADIKESAERFAADTARGMGTLLTSSKYQVTFVDFVLSATTLTLKYEWTFDPQSPNVSSLDKNIDKTFGVDGTTVNLSGNKLVIVFPMPKEFHIPIDVRTLYLEVFGGDDPNANDD